MRNLFFSLILPLAALVAGGYVARHAFSEGMHTVIASDRGPPKYDDSPSFGTEAGRCRWAIDRKSPGLFRNAGHSVTRLRGDSVRPARRRPRHFSSC